MKKIVTVIIVFCLAVLSFTGCGIQKNNEDSNRVSIKNMVSEIQVASGYVEDDSFEMYSISDDYRERLIAIYDDVINNEKGRTIEDVENALVDGGYIVKFYNGKKELDMGINGRYFIYKSLYYKIPDESYDEIYRMLENACHSEAYELLSKITSGVVTVYQDCLVVGELTDDAKLGIINICDKVIKNEKPVVDIEDIDGGTTLVFYDKNAEIIEDISLNNRYIIFKNNYYLIPDDLYENTKKYMKSINTENDKSMLLD